MVGRRGSVIAMPLAGSAGAASAAARASAIARAMPSGARSVIAALPLRRDLNPRSSDEVVILSALAAVLG
jgi:hypothetical protein